MPTIPDDRQLLQLYLRWWTTTERRSEQTIEHYLDELARLADTLDGRSLLTADRFTLEAYVGERCEVSPNVGRFAFRAVRSFFKWAESREVIEVNPAVKLTAPKEPKNPVPTTVTEAAFRTLVGSIDGSALNDVRDRAIAWVLWSTGVRRGELVRMETHHLDLAERTVLIPITKTNRPRIVPLMPEALDALATWLELRFSLHPTTDDVWLAKYRGEVQPMTANAVRLMLERRRRTAGVDLSAHAFRRGSAAAKLRAGLSQVAVEQIHGWVPGSPMAASYVRAIAGEVAVDEFRRAFG